ncbi:hypothetical protein E2320_004713 [Naja naja]|nr:hypothetical protein E2320_004713 [Naja naja]
MKRTVAELPKNTMHSSEETENIKMFFRQQHSFVNSKIIFTASELGVFDLLRESGEPLPSATVAERLKTSLTGMQILLQACVELKVLKVEWKEGKDLYGNTEFADLFLAKSSPKSQYYTMKFFSECAYLSLQYLPEAVRSKEGVENFFRYMDEAWSLHGKEVVSAFDLSGFQLICDLGGSSCGLAKELISKYPNCTVKIFDLPEVVEISKKYNAFSEDSQITFHEGNMCFETITSISKSTSIQIVVLIISTACELGVFDVLRESGELLSSTTIAERLSTSPIGMKRLLEACVGLNLLTLEWKDGKDLYGNTDFTNLYLVKSSPKSQYHSIIFHSEVVYPSMQYLPDAVRSKEELQTFSNFMNELWPVLGREVLSAFDLSQFPLICDLGGSTGGLAKELISLYPKCTVTIFDLPEVVEASKNHCLPSEDTQITFHAGDFFKDPLPEADLYILARILHDWSDERCSQLLHKVYQACKPGGGVLIVEMLLDEDRRGPLAAHIYALLVLLYLEGKERSTTEFNVLLRKAGFQEVELKKGNLFHIILGRK